ncbi:MAG TPA: hypothetical protein VMK65_12790, partial [Longimicrobiales bacterium]|nr:hypothetical protein [Longimicrobiales bacterium]
LRDYDVHITATIEHGQTSSGGDLPQYQQVVSRASRIGADPGQGWTIPDRPAAGDWSGFYGDEGELFADDVPTFPQGPHVLGMLLSSAWNEAHTHLEDAMRNWWDGGCLEIRLAEPPHRTRLQPGDSTAFALEVWHYQEEAAVAVPLEVSAQAPNINFYGVDGGVVTPKTSAGSPAEITFTAPGERASPQWSITEISARTSSRRGRAFALDLLTFTRRGRESYAVTVRQTVTSDRDGVLRQMTWEALLKPTPDDPSSLAASGSLTGRVRDVARHSLTCDVQWDRETPITGGLDAAASGGTLVENPGSLFGDELLYLTLLTRDQQQMYTNAPQGVELNTLTNGARTEQRAPCAGGCAGKEQDWCTTVEEIVVRPVAPGR